MTKQTTQVEPISVPMTASLTKLAMMVALCDQTPDSWYEYYDTINAELSSYVLQVTTGQHKELTVQDPRFQVEVLRQTLLLDLVSQLMSAITVTNNAQ